MKTRRLWFPVLVVGLFALGQWAPPTATGQDAGGPGNQRGVVFVGSSIFHRWIDLRSQMAPLPIVNRAIDGTQTSDMLRMLDSVVRDRPKVIAYYCGSNDVGAGEPAAAIFDRIRQFIVRVTTALPQVHVVFVSINRAPEKQERWGVVDAVNRLVEVYASQTKHLRYVDVNPVLFNRDGTPRIELYLSDQLHLRPAAYEEFARVLKPVLTELFEMP